MCHVSCVMCHVSCVMCHVSHMTNVCICCIFFIFYFLCVITIFLKRCVYSGSKFIQISPNISKLCNGNNLPTIRCIWICWEVIPFYISHLQSQLSTLKFNMYYVNSCINKNISTCIRNSSVYKWNITRNYIHICVSHTLCSRVSHVNFTLPSSV